VAGELRRGSFTIRARRGGTQPATVRASARGRLVASGTALPDGAGLAPLTLRLTAAGRRLLRREGSLKVQIAIGTRNAIKMTLRR
jgi:hypothetical protein